MRAKRVTSQDVARRAGVSRTTVSLVLNRVASAQISPDTAERVLQAAAELGYVPDAAARALASRKADAIGLVVSRPQQSIASDAFITQAITGVMAALRPSGMHLLLAAVEEPDDPNSYLDIAHARHVDGILLSGTRFDDEGLNRLASGGFPVVLIGSLPGSDLPSVDVDNERSARLAVQHLISLGHRRIACITNGPAAFVAPIDRLQGYRQALEDAGLPFDESLLRFGDFSPESGYSAMQSLLQSRVDFDAAFVASDVVAFGALAALREHGRRVPQDVALVGFDDLPLARFAAPPLTSIHLPVEQLARRAAEALLALIHDETLAEPHILLETHLIVRASCGAHQGGLSSESPEK